MLLRPIAISLIVTATFTLNAGAQTIHYVNQTGYAVGDPIEIAGDGFGPQAGSIRIKAAGIDKKLKVLSWSDTLVTAYLKKKAKSGYYDLVLKTADKDKVKAPSAVIIAPPEIVQIDHFQPACDGNGTLVITGWHLIGKGNKPKIKVQGKKASILESSDPAGLGTDKITVQVPKSAKSGSATVKLKNKNGKAPFEIALDVPEPGDPIGEPQMSVLFLGQNHETSEVTSEAYGIQGFEIDGVPFTRVHAEFDFGGLWILLPPTFECGQVGKTLDGNMLTNGEPWWIALWIDSPGGLYNAGNIAAHVSTINFKVEKLQGDQIQMRLWGHAAKDISTIKPYDISLTADYPVGE